MQVKGRLGARGWRTHPDLQIDKLMASIKQFGFVAPIVIDRDGNIVAGHGRLIAATKLGLPKVPVVLVDHLTEEQKHAYLIADNKLAELSGWDEELLAREMASLQRARFDLDLTGFGPKECLALLRTLEVVPGLTPDDAAPERPTVPVTRPGDCWTLGPHRLFCGDATKPEDVAKLMQGDMADLVFTDPPYNVDYEGYTADALKIQNDAMPAGEFTLLLEAAFRCMRKVMKAGASAYICHASSWQREFQTALELAGLAVRAQIIWAKNSFAWGFGRYKFQHEPIFYVYVKGESDAWYGDLSQSTLWHESKPAANRLHPTMKPVELIERALVNSSKPGDVVLDLFGGSGSTLIACQKRNECARIMELDPRYCDVIILRWQEFTGQAAIRADGSKFEAHRGS